MVICILLSFHFSFPFLTHPSIHPPINPSINHSINPPLCPFLGGGGPHFARMQNTIALNNLASRVTMLGEIPHNRYVLVFCLVFLSCLALP